MHLKLEEACNAVGNIQMPALTPRKSPARPEVTEMALLLLLCRNDQGMAHAAFA